MQTIRKVLNQPKQWQFLMVCAAIGALSFFVIYGVRTLDVSNESWIWPAVPEGDVVQNYAGWMAFRSSSWEFPLARTDGICWPDGTVIAYMDANPLLSTVLKFFSPMLPQTFVVFGWFTLGCFVFQGMAAGLLAQLYAQKVWHAYLIIPLFTFSPILIERSFRHTQMAAQCLILFALYFYLLMRRQGYTKFPWQFILLNVLAIGLFPYFLPMVMALLFAGLVESVQANRKVIKPLVFLLINIVVSLAVGYILGVLGWQGSNYSRGGYGYFSMNLNAPFNPSSLGDYQWSWVLGGLPQHSGQYDGFNYLGLGVLLFLFFAIVDRLLRVAKRDGTFVWSLWNEGLVFVKRHMVLLLVCAGLTLFAVSNTVVLSGRTLLDIPLPRALDVLFGIFRASSRLFYPVYYILMLFVVRYLLVVFSKKQAALLAVLLVGMQLLDLSGVVVQKHRYFAHPPVVEWVLTDNVLSEAAARSEFLILLEDIDINHYYTAFAAKNELKTNIRTVNSGYYPQAEAVGEKALALLLTGKVQHNTIYVAESAEVRSALCAVLDPNTALLYEYDGYLFIIPRR